MTTSAGTVAGPSGRGSRAAAAVSPSLPSVCPPPPRRRTGLAPLHGLESVHPTRSIRSRNRSTRRRPIPQSSNAVASTPRVSISGSWDRRGMNPHMRDRRSPLFGAPAGTSQGQADYDPEAMEKENDKSVSDIGDRVNLLKNITKGIQDEVHTQHGMLDGMGLDMAGARGMLGGTVDKLGKVMENASNKKIMYTVGAIVVGFLFLYFWLR